MQEHFQKIEMYLEDLTNSFNIKNEYYVFHLLDNFFSSICLEVQKLKKINHITDVKKIYFAY